MSCSPAEATLLKRRGRSPYVLECEESKAREGGGQNLKGGIDDSTNFHFPEDRGERKWVRHHGVNREEKTETFNGCTRWKKTEPDIYGAADQGEEQSSDRWRRTILMGQLV